MEKKAALSGANAHLFGTGLVADADDVHRNELQQLWLIGSYDPRQPGDVMGAIAVCVRDDGTVYDVNRAPFEPEWDGVVYPDCEPDSYQAAG